MAHPGQDRPAVLIGARLRAACNQRSLTRDQVTLAPGPTKGLVSRLERDDVSPSVASLVAACEILGLRVGDLLDPPATAVLRAGEAECAYVLSGTLEVVLESGKEMLRPGDALTFPGNAPHTWRNPDAETCEVLWILAPAP